MTFKHRSKRSCPAAGASRSTSRATTVIRNQRLVQIRELVRYLDRQTPQVLVESRIVEANSNAQAMGVQWGSEIDATTRTGCGTGLFFPSGVGVGGTIGRLGTGVLLGRHRCFMVDMGAESATVVWRSAWAASLASSTSMRLGALETDGFGKVISQPRVTTLDNKSARIRGRGFRSTPRPVVPTSSSSRRMREMRRTSRPTTKSSVKVASMGDSRNLSSAPGHSDQGSRDGSNFVVTATPRLWVVFLNRAQLQPGPRPWISKIPLIGYLFKNSAGAEPQRAARVPHAAHCHAPQRGEQASLG